MKRTIYQNRILVDQITLNNLEDSKIDEILKRQKLLGSAGIVSGLNITPFNINISVSPGTAVLPSGEVVELTTTQSNLPLATYEFEQFNLVVLNYSESFSLSRENEKGEDEQNLFAAVTPTVSVLTVDQYLSLPISQDFLIIGIVVGQGEGVALKSDNILNAEFDLNIYNFSDLQVLKGIIIKSSNISPTNDYGYFRYHFPSRQLRFVSPNNPNTVTSTTGRVINLSQNLTNVILTDPDVPEDTITVDIYGTTLPASTASIDSSDLSAFTSEGLITGNLVEEPIDFSSLYTDNLFDLDSDNRVEIPKSSAKDRSHREKLGNGFSNDRNPHGISLSDIIKVFETIQGSISLGDDLLSYPEEAVYSRIKNEASRNSPYLLVLETELPGQGAISIAPVRLYANSLNPSEIEDDEDVRNTHLSGLFLTFNARYDLENDLWYKDNVDFEQIPSIRVELGSDSFDVSMNQGDLEFADLDGWSKKLFTNFSYNLFSESLGIISQANDNLVQDFTAILNAAQVSGVDRPNMIPLYEDVHNSNGGLRIYYGQELNTGTGEARIDFYLNAKPNIGEGTWTKDLGSNPDTGFLGYSYFFRYRFGSNQIEVGQYTGENLTFSSWDKQELLFEGGIEIPSSSQLRGAFRINSIRYENVRKRIKIVNLGDIGYSANPEFRRERFPEGSANVGDSSSDRYFERSSGNTTLMGVGVPVIADIENRRKTIGSESNTPRLVWRGPEKDFWKSDDKPSTSQADACYIGTREVVPGQSIKFTFPITFEENEIMIERIRIPWDWENAPSNASGIDQIQEFGFQDNVGSSPGDEPFFAVRINKVNILTGENVQDISPNFGALNPIRYQTLRTASPANEMVLVMEVPAASSEDYLITLSNEDLEENEIYQLQVQTNYLIEDRSDTYRKRGTSPSAANGQVFQIRPIIIGNCVIEYDTFNIE